MASDNKFVDGLRVYSPRDGAPDFVICNLVINVQELAAWLARQSGDVRVDVKRSRNDKLYASVNDWRPEGQRQERQRPAQPTPEETGGGFKDDDIPFRQLGKRCHWVA
jgi:hypothetical protein